MEKVINNMTVEDALVKFEPMVHKMVNSANTNCVCNKEDLIQEGRLAIIEAFDRYSADKNCTLSTWTYCYIRGAILDYQKNNLSILGSSAYLQGILRKTGEEVSVDELTKNHGLWKSTAVAATYIKNGYTPASYDELNDMIDTDDTRISHPLSFFDWRKYLTETEIFIVERRYGFTGEAIPMTEIGKELGMSRKSVSYHLQIAINKLKRIPGIEDFAFD